MLSVCGLPVNCSGCRRGLAVKNTLKNIEEFCFTCLHENA